MNQAQVERIVNQIDEAMDEADFDYEHSVQSCNDGEISIFVDTWQVNEDPVGCMQDISGVCASFPELGEEETECHESVVVTYKVIGFVEEDEA